MEMSPQKTLHDMLQLRYIKGDNRSSSNEKIKIEQLASYQSEARLPGTDHARKESEYVILIDPESRKLIHPMNDQEKDDDDPLRKQEASLIEAERQLDPKLGDMGFIEVENLDNLHEAEKVSNMMSSLRSLHRQSIIMKNQLIFKPVLRNQLHSQGRQRLKQSPLKNLLAQPAGTNDGFDTLRDQGNMFKTMREMCGHTDMGSLNADMNKTVTSDSIYHLPQTFEVTLNALQSSPNNQQLLHRSRNLIKEPQLKESNSV